MNDKLADLRKHGQSLWYDNIARDLLNSGELQRLVDEGITGLTSNPSIFKKAITKSSTYDEQLRELAQQGKGTKDIYEAMAMDDIRRAADILRPVYDRTECADGYVSLEVSPHLAHDTQGTIGEAARLFKQVDRPNLMIKIPGTPEGLPAVEESLANGLNINVTLIFSRKTYEHIMEAYIKGLERRVKAGQPLNTIASVASFFVSRVDTMVDRMLSERIVATGTGNLTEQGRMRGLKGKVAIANARLAYQQFKKTFESERFKALKENGAHVQRPVWASTSTKNPIYSDVMYVEGLIGPHTVNTAPPHTIEAFLDHGRVTATLEQWVGETQMVMSELAAIEIDMDAVTQHLLDEGVEAFADSFDDLLEVIEEKRKEFAAERAS